MAATTRAVKANGISFTCLEEGEGPLVLLVHGFPDTAHSWDALRPTLAAAGFRAVSPFTRGYAPTELAPDGDYRMEALADDVVALIEALGEQSAIVVGHDWGSPAVHGAAIKAPERVRMMVTVAIPHPASVRLTPALVWRARHFLAHRRRGAARRLRANDFARVDQLVRRWSPAWQPAPGETAAVKRAFAEPGCLEAALGYYRAAGNSVPGFLRARVAVPSLAFAGATDYGVRPAAFEKARSWYTGGYEVVTLPGGHFLHREHPDQFAAELLRRLPPAQQSMAR